MLVARDSPAASAGRITLIVALFVGQSAVVWIYRETFASIVQKWLDDAAFSHGFLIVPISCWLAWAKRRELSAIAWRPSWLGFGAIALLVASWVVASGAGILVAEQLAAAAMLSALVPTVLGWSAARCLAFPLCFLLFVVPFGRGLVPFLMDVTTDVATWALQSSGIPVYRDGMILNIPYGYFEVARACSGLNYVIAGFVLGVLYAYLTYRSVRKRALAVLAFLVIPILANGVRVYLTVAVSYLTKMRFGPGYEHVTFGRILFIVVVGLMFWVGHRWRDRDGDVTSRELVAARSEPRKDHWAAVFAAVAVVLIGPPFRDSSIEVARRNASGAFVNPSLPGMQGEWRGPLAAAGSWRPSYSSGLAEAAAAYVPADGVPVDVFVAVYGLGASTASEMITFDNRLVATDNKVLAHSSTREVTLSGSRTIEVTERTVVDHRGDRLVWYWFVVGDTVANSPYAVKGLEALSFIRRAGDLERIVAISTPLLGDAAGRLGRLLAAQGRCLELGYSPAVCGR